MRQTYDPAGLNVTHAESIHMSQIRPYNMQRLTFRHRAHMSNIFGDRCFAAAGPRLWNSLPISL